MEQTRTDFAAILASAIAFFLAVYGVVFGPVTVDSTRPSGFKQTEKGDKPDVADARLWDDPFVVFPDTVPYRYQPLDLSGNPNALILLVPVSTRLYEEDRESRLRLRMPGDSKLPAGDTAQVAAYNDAAFGFTRITVDLNKKRLTGEFFAVFGEKTPEPQTPRLADSFLLDLEAKHLVG
jgi:hypothetical protein